MNVWYGTHCEVWGAEDDEGYAILSQLPPTTEFPDFAVYCDLDDAYCPMNWIAVTVNG